MHVLSYWEHWLMRIQHRMICQPSCRISAVNVRGVREGKGGKEETEDRKHAKTGNKSNIKLKLSNIRYHLNCFRDFSNKLQINAAMSTCYQTSSDKEPLNYILKIILNKKSKIWNTNELLDAFRDKGSTEWNSTRLVNTPCLIKNADDDKWYANHLPGSQQ